MPQTPDTPTAQQRLASAQTAFIAKHLPPWLKQASPEQIKRLRASFRSHRESQERLRKVTLDLIPLQSFGQKQMTSLLIDGLVFEGLEWVEIRRKFTPPMSIGLPEDEVITLRQPALLRLMQNFQENASFYTGTGLVRKGEGDALVADTDALIANCRKLDAGKAYQELLTKVFTPAAQKELAADKRDGLALTIEIAALKGEIDIDEQVALREVAGTATAGKVLHGYPGLLKMLGCPVADALVVQLRDAQGEDKGVVLYLPSDPARALRRYASWGALSAALVKDLKQAPYRQYFSQLIRIDERVGFLEKLALRLRDEQPDLELDGKAHQGDIWANLVVQQVERVQADARVLLVPSADADHAASEARLNTWEAVGLGVLNLAGLFIPVVGELLLGQLVVQTLSEVYEGAADWYHGHQHEALEHMLDVAETVVATAVVAGGATLIARSDFIKGLEPVNVDDDNARLWNADMSAYASTPEGAELQPDGLFKRGERQWIRAQGAYYEVHRPDPEGPWRVRHPQREGAFGPTVVSNGERSWRLRVARPLEWQDSAQMLETLWPQEPPLTAEQANQILQVAGVDTDELRGVLVENRHVPFNLRDTLRRFEADKRIDGFFQRLQTDTLVSTDDALLNYCKRQPGLSGIAPEELNQRLLQDQASVGEQLLEQMTDEPLSDPELGSLVLRDFPGLPRAYVDAALTDTTARQRSLALIESRLPLKVSTNARALLQRARLSRAMEGLYLSNAYRDETAELVVAMLRRLPGWPKEVNLEVRHGSDSGRLITVLDPQGAQADRTILVREQGRFNLYYANGHRRPEDPDDPAGICQAIVAMLTPQQLGKLGLADEDPAGQLRVKLQGQVPATSTGQLRLLGWTPSPSWFNPGQRMADGRVGYPLSGRSPGRPPAATTLRTRIRALYWGFTDDQVEEFLARLQQNPNTMFDTLLDHERNYARLDRALIHWQNAEEDDSLRFLRRQLAQRLRRCWRLQGEQIFDASGQAAGMRLDLSGLAVRSLPVIPWETDFSHVTGLVLSGMQLEGVATDFLRSFSELRQLNLNNNRLQELPLGIAYLTELRELRLGRNSLRLGQQATEVLTSLPNVRLLNLSYNPLTRLSLRFHHLPRLCELHLRSCQLTSWPRGLELCGLLELADLRNNAIASVPAEILQMPAAYRRAYIVDGNPLPGSDQLRLMAPDPLHAHEGAAQSYPADQARSRSQWVESSDQALQAARAQQWGTLSNSAGSSSFFELLGRLEHTSDFNAEHAYLHEQVWQLLGAMEADSDLRTRVFARASVPPTCDDSVIDLFSELQVEMLVAQAGQGDEQQREGALVTLGRRLFRLDRLNQYARQDIANRLAEQRPTDEIEVSLFYRVELAAALDLPSQPRTMIFRREARVNAAQIDEARATVTAAERTDALRQSLSQRDFWRGYLQAEHEQAFAEISHAFDERGTELDARIDDMSSAEYEQAWSTLKAEREAEIQTLMLTLTQEALDRHPLADR